MIQNFAQSRAVLREVSDEYFFTMVLQLYGHSWGSYVTDLVAATELIDTLACAARVFW